MESATHTELRSIPPMLGTDPYSDPVKKDPYSFFTELRETGAVVRMTHHDAYAAGRYEEVRTIFSDNERFKTTSGIGLSNITKPGAWGRHPSAILESDPPQHIPLRTALTRIISPIVIRKWRATFEKEAARMVEEMIDKRDFDGADEVAIPYVLKVFTDAIGLTMTREQAKALGELNQNQLGPMDDILEESLREAEPHMDYYSRQLRRETLTPGGVGDQIYAAADNGQFPAELAPEIIRTFVRGGMDTTMGGIGATFRFLAIHPAQWDMVRANPARSRDAFEEAIRLDSPSQLSYRTTRYDTELAGYFLPAESKVAAFSASANTDPRKWDRPLEFDIDREKKDHLAFGAGPHVCLGQALARLEAEVILSEFAKRAKRIELVGEPVYRRANTMRCLCSLPLRVVPE